MKKYTQEPNQPKPNHEQNQKLNRLNNDATGKSPLYIKADLNKSDYFTNSLSVLKNCFNATTHTIAKAITLRISFDSIILPSFTVMENSVKYCEYSTQTKIGYKHHYSIRIHVCQTTV